MLIGMKSTHNQNYAEYVNKSIEQFNNESTRIDQLYQNAVNNANEDYKNKGSLIQADYERHMKDYEEAKKELDGAYEKSLRITILKRQAYDALTKDSQNAIDGIEAGKFQQARDNIWKNPQFKEGKDENEYDPNVPLVNMFEQLTTKEGNPGQQTFEVASQALTNRLKNMDGAQAASELSGKWMSQVKNMLTSGDYNQNEKDQIKMFARDLVQRVKPQVTSNIKQNGSVAYNLFSQLGETDSYWSGKKPAKTREAFITDNSKISPAILGYVYDGWKQFVKGQQYANVGGNVDPNEELKAAVNRGLENGMTKEETASNLVSTFYVNGLLSSVMAQ